MQYTRLQKAPRASAPALTRYLAPGASALQRRAGFNLWAFFKTPYGMMIGTTQHTWGPGWAARAGSSAPRAPLLRKYSQVLPTLGTPCLPRQRCALHSEPRLTSAAPVPVPLPASAPGFMAFSMFILPKLRVDPDEYKEMLEERKREKAAPPTATAPRLRRKDD